jgi:hypothetical protein
MLEKMKEENRKKADAHFKTLGSLLPYAHTLTQGKQGIDSTLCRYKVPSTLVCSKRFDWSHYDVLNTRNNLRRYTPKYPPDVEHHLVPIYAAISGVLSPYQDKLLDISVDELFNRVVYASNDMLGFLTNEKNEFFEHEGFPRISFIACCFWAGFCDRLKFYIVFAEEKVETEEEDVETSPFILWDFFFILLK